MNIILSSLYSRDIKKLKVDISSQLEKTLELLHSNLSHPSLHNKHIQCKREKNLYSIRVNKQFRVLYILNKDKEEIIIYRLLSHDKYDRLTSEC
jgi:mRNA-degrading endonuclease RelE of RelBE toxin-antitoxin system